VFSSGSGGISVNFGGRYKRCVNYFIGKGTGAFSKEECSMPVIDLLFPLLGHEIPADHGYCLYSAVSRELPFVHREGAQGVTFGIHPIQGFFVGKRKILLNRRSKLSIRLLSEHIPDVLPLAGKKLDLDGHSISLGIPSPFLLSQASCLYSRLVIIKGFMESKTFLEAARRQCLEIGVDPAKISLVPHWTKRSFEGAVSDGGEVAFTKRTLRIHDKEIVGFAVKAEGLLPEESLLLQEAGLGGRRKMGCGVFIPSILSHDA